MCFADLNARPCPSSPPWGLSGHTLLTEPLLTVPPVLYAEYAWTPFSSSSGMESGSNVGSTLILLLPLLATLRTSPQGSGLFHSVWTITLHVPPCSDFCLLGLEWECGPAKHTSVSNKELSPGTLTLPVLSLLPQHESSKTMAYAALYI